MQSSFFSEYLFVIPLLTMLLSEVAKYAIDRLATGKWHHRLFRHGGMPSSHSALVTSLMIIVSKTLSVHSVEFAIVVIFACIVWYDAMAVRSAVGKHAKALNSMQDLYEFSEKIGHSMAEVLAGIAFGAAVTMLGINLFF